MTDLPRRRRNGLHVAVSLVLATLLPAQAAFAVPERGESDAAQAGSATAFDVWEYRVLGNSVLPAASIERAVYPHLGPGRTLDDVELARAALETAFREAGYGTVFVDIPEQSVDEGVVRLQVTEGRLDRIRVSGARYFSNRRILEQLPALESGTVPRLPAVQEQVAAVNRASADRAIVPVLKAGRTPGTVDIDLKVQDSLPVHGTLELNNRYTANTRPLRASGSLTYGNLWDRQHSFSLQYQTAPEETDDVQALVASYLFRPESLPDTTLVFYAVDSNSDVASLGALSVVGNGQIYGALAIRSLPALGNLFHGVTFGVDYKDLLEDIQIDEDNALTTPIQYLNWSVSYAGALRRETSLSNFSLGANFGLRGLVNDPYEFADKRFRGAPNYFYLRGGVDHTRELPGGLQLFVAASAQVAAHPLVSNEQFALGGVESVRGYLESLVFADNGVQGSLELRSPSLAGLWAPLDELRFHVFTDAGAGRIKEPLPDQQASFSLWSAGVGFRLRAFDGLDAGFDFAWPLEDEGEVSAGDTRSHFGIAYSF